MDFPEFDFMSLDDLREMMRQCVLTGPFERDKTFVHRLAHAIAERKKASGVVPMASAPGSSRKRIDEPGST